LSEEKLRTQRQVTRKLELQNAITEGTLLDRRELMRTFAVIADAIVSRINAATEVPRNVREDLLRDFVDVARRSQRDYFSTDQVLARSRRARRSRRG